MSSRWERRLAGSSGWSNNVSLAFIDYLGQLLEISCGSSSRCFLPTLEMVWWMTERCLIIARSPGHKVTWSLTSSLSNEQPQSPTDYCMKQHLHVGTRLPLSPLFLSLPSCPYRTPTTHSTFWPACWLGPRVRCLWWVTLTSPSTASGVQSLRIWRHTWSQTSGTDWTQSSSGPTTGESWRGCKCFWPCVNFSRHRGRQVASDAV